MNSEEQRKLRVGNFYGEKDSSCLRETEGDLKNGFPPCPLFKGSFREQNHKVDAKS